MNYIICIFWACLIDFSIEDSDFIVSAAGPTVKGSGCQFVSWYLHNGLFLCHRVSSSNSFQLRKGVK
jgi:hypothetical protein